MRAVRVNRPGNQNSELKNAELIRRDEGSCRFIIRCGFVTHSHVTHCLC